VGGKDSKGFPGSQEYGGELFEFMFCSSGFYKYDGEVNAVDLSGRDLFKFKGPF
jgi:hypothetical protein